MSIRRAVLVGRSLLIGLSFLSLVCVGRSFLDGKYVLVVRRLVGRSVG